MNKFFVVFLLAGLTCSVTVGAQSKIEATIKGEGALVWGIDTNTMASGFANEFVSELKVDLIKPGTTYSEGKTPVFGSVELKDFQFSVVQDSNNLAGWDSEVPLPDGTDRTKGGFIFIPPTVTGRINTSIADVPVWIELAAGRPGDSGDVWVLNFASPYASSDNWAGPQDNWAGQSISIDTALKDYNERWDVLLNLGNGPTERRTSQGWSTGGFNIGIGLFETALHFSSLGDWKSRTVEWLDSNGLKQSKEVAPNVQGAYSAGFEMKLPLGSGFDLRLGSGLAMLSLGSYELDKVGLSVKPGFTTAIGENGTFSINVGSDTIFPKGDARKALYDLAVASKLMPVSGVSLGLDAYWRDDLSNPVARIAAMKTFNAKISLSEGFGNEGLVPVLGTKVSVGIYDILGTNKQSYFYDEITGKSSPTWDLQVSSDLELGRYLIPYGSMAVGSTRKAYTNSTFDSLGNYYGGQAIPASLVGSADTWKKIGYEAGIKVVKLIDLATIDLRYTSAGVITIDIRVAY